MIRYLLDTNIAISVMQGVPRVLELATEKIAAGAVAISSCSIGELYYGIHAATNGERERAAVEELIAALEILDYDEIAAREYGRLRAQMRRQGQLIPTMDTQIAAIAVANRLIVASADKHFTYIPNLPVENWLD